MIYLDSSALLKLLVEERESEALAEWLTGRAAEPTVSSELARVEVLRATRRLHPDALPAARVLIGQLDLVPLGRGLIDAAAELGGPLLRTLDALHLASALSLGDALAVIVAYDRRLLDAAAAAGVATVAPGA